MQRVWIPRVWEDDHKGITLSLPAAVLLFRGGSYWARKREFIAPLMSAHEVPLKVNSVGGKILTPRCIYL